MPDATCTTFGERLSAIADYDGIKECDRVKHLTDACGLSRYMARLVLSGKEPRRMVHVRKIASGLDVQLAWLGFGAAPAHFHPRTCRIIVQQIKGRTKEETNRVIRLFVAYRAGHQRALNLIGFVKDGKLTVDHAAELMAV